MIASFGEKKWVNIVTLMTLWNEWRFFCRFLFFSPPSISFQSNPSYYFKVSYLVEVSCRHFRLHCHWIVGPFHFHFHLPRSVFGCAMSPFITPLSKMEWFNVVSQRYSPQNILSSSFSSCIGYRQSAYRIWPVIPLLLSYAKFSVAAAAAKPSIMLVFVWLIIFRGTFNPIQFVGINHKMLEGSLKLPRRTLRASIEREAVGFPKSAIFVAEEAVSE